MMLLGMLGGMAWAGVPALLRNRFGANEILTSLMLVYVAQYLLDWLVRGPWRDPHGFNFPKSISFNDWHLLATFGDGQVHLGAVFAVIAVAVLYIFMSRTLKGFEIRATGEAPPPPPRQRLRRLLAAGDHVALFRALRGPGGTGGHLRGGGAPSDSSSPPSRRATDSPPSSWHSSDG